MSAITWNEETLNTMLTTPSEALISDLGRLKGDIMILGAGGKMGPDLCILAKRASAAAGVVRRVYAVSRFSDRESAARLQREEVEIIPADLTKEGTLDALPDCKNIIFMVGRKFGTDGSEHPTWGMNTWLPCMTARRYADSGIVVFSTGNLYPKVPVSSGGASEAVPPEPIGDYAMSCLGRERMFQYAAGTYGTRIALMRLNYAIDLRYGVLHDLAETILENRPVNLAAMPAFNCIWQKDANEAALRLLLHTDASAPIMNVTGPETAGVRFCAETLAELLGKDVQFTGEPAETALLSNAGLMFSRLGYPTVPLHTLLQWQAEWILSGGRSLNKPTHFEERNGKY